MMGKLHGLREPRFHISRRYECPLWKRWLIRVVAVILALLIDAAVIRALSGLNALAVYRTIFDGALGSNRKIWITIRDTMILLSISVAITPAFRMRFWNVGAEGQALIGGVATAAVMINLAERVPEWMLVIAMLLAALLAGAFWGLVPAFFKARWNTNETLFTLMMNYIATQVCAYCIIHWENPAGSNSVGVINQKTNIGWFKPLFGFQYGWNVVIVLIVTALVYFYLRSTKHGYEIAYVGQSVNTARYAGISVSRVIARTMAVSGGLCGLTGFILVSGTGHTISTGIVGGRGFTAIVVAWLSKLNTFTMIFVSFLLVFMDKGASQTAS